MADDEPLQDQPSEIVDVEQDSRNPSEADDSSDSSRGPNFEVRRTSISAEAYFGPLPPPGMLRELDEVYPGSAKLVMENFAEQSSHRRELERRHQWHANARSWGGLVSGAIVVLSAFILAGYMVSQEESGKGIALAMASIASLAGVFVIGRYMQSKELASKPKPPSDSSGG